MDNNEFQKMFAAFADKKDFSHHNINNINSEELLKSLNEEQAQQVKSIMSDPKKTQEILNSPMAKALIKRLMNNG